MPIETLVELLRQLEGTGDGKISDAQFRALFEAYYQGHKDALKNKKKQ